MTNEALDAEARWLQAPLESKEVRIFVAVAEDAELSPEMRDALEQLAIAMQSEASEVEGYLMGGCSECTCHGGGTFSCGGGYSSKAIGSLASRTSAPMSFSLFKGPTGLPGR